MHPRSFLTRSLLAGTFVVTTALLQQETKAIQFDISSIPGTDIKFVGSGTTATFSFTDDGAGNNFQIDGVTGGGGTLVGSKGTFAGSWTLGPVTTVTLVPLVETAPVTGTGTLAIHGPGGFDLTADIAWVQASSLKTAISVATLGVTGNISNVAYSGTDPDLLAFLNEGPPRTGVLSFTFPTPGKSLKQLVSSSGNPKMTTYSGNLTTAPDSGTTTVLLGLGLLGLAAVQARPKRA